MSECQLALLAFDSGAIEGQGRLIVIAKRADDSLDCAVVELDPGDLREDRQIVR